MAGNNVTCPVQLKCKRSTKSIRKEVPGAFPWTSKEAKNFQFLDKSQVYQTEYSACYRPFQSKSRKPFKPAYKTIGGQPFDGTTSYKAVYVKHPIKKREEAPKEVYVKTPGNIQDRTIYKQDYSAYTEKQRKHSKGGLCKPKDSYSGPTVKFKGSSIYTSSFPPYDSELAKSCRSKIVKPSENLQVPVKAANDKKKTTFQEDFKPPAAVRPPDRIIPAENKIQPEGPFDGTTVYKKAFTPHPTEPIVIAKAPQTTSQENAPFVAITTNMADYVNHGTVGRAQCCRPTENNSMMSDLPFQGESTQSAAYKAWPTQARVVPTWGRDKEYKKANGKLILSTTYGADFKNPGVIQKAGACRPVLNKDTITKSSGQARLLTTTYDASFQVWKGAKPAELCQKQVNVYKPPTDSMNVFSTQQSHFKGIQTERAVLCRHPSEHRELDVERKNMMFNTTYRDTYKGHSIIG